MAICLASNFCFEKLSLTGPARGALTNVQTTHTEKIYGAIFYPLFFLFPLTESSLGVGGQSYLISSTVSADKHHYG